VKRTKICMSRPSRDKGGEARVHGRFCRWDETAVKAWRLAVRDSDSPSIFFTISPTVVDSLVYLNVCRQSQKPVLCPPPLQRSRWTRQLFAHFHHRCQHRGQLVAEPSPHLQLKTRPNTTLHDTTTTSSRISTAHHVWSTAADLSLAPRPKKKDESRTEALAYTDTQCRSHTGMSRDRERSLHTMLTHRCRIYSEGSFMNPGPAPRPPTDRPRLALTPNVNNVAGNMSQLSLQSPGLGSSTSSLQRSMTDFGSSRNESSAVKSGWAKVKEEGGFMKGVFWSEKFLVLREKALDFQKSDTTPKISFSIPLKDVLNITRSETIPYSFELTRGTPGNEKMVICKFETDNDVYGWIDVIYNKSPTMGGVSHPTSFAHRIHVGFDPVTGGFVGLPVEWQKLLNSSALTQDDMAKNPQAVVEALEFYTSKLQKRADDPKQYPSLTPTPPIDAHGNRQLGHGNGIAPPRPQPPAQYTRKESYSSTRNVSPAGSQPSLSRTNTAPQYDPRIEDERRRKEDERRRMLEKQRAYEDAQRREAQELADYNASLPKHKLPLAQQEIGGGGYASDRDASPASRYNPSRPAPPAPSSSGQKVNPVRQLTAQRQAPTAPSANGSSSIPRPSPSSQRQQSPSDSRKPSGQAGIAGVHMPSGSSQQREHSPAAPKPLNVAAKQPTGAPMDPIKKAEMALTAAPPKKEEPRKDVRMSSMTDAQVMEKLREVVSKERPLDSYNKQKKIGQGASGSVYVARIRESATSPTARQQLRENGPRAQVAIKQMDLRNQPRKELIVNEIIVMKDSKHPNIVNFLDAFLQEESNELWVVMEFMEGGALTDVIDNNPSISEPQIATICHEVSFEPSNSIGTTS